MGKPLKIILSIVAGLVLLVVLVLGAAFLFIQPNDFKPEIIAAVKEKTGRDLVIDGDLKLAFFPALGLSSGKMTLGNATGFEQPNFASLEQSHINFELLPLLSKKIEINRVVLTGLTLNLAKNQQGVGNWEDLTKKKTPLSASMATSSPSQQQIAAAATVGTAAVLSSFSVGAITLENSQVNWQDLKTGKNLVIKDLKLNTDKANFNQPVAVDWSFVMVDAASNTTQTVKINTTLTTNEKFDTISLARSSLQTVTTGESIPNKSLTSTLTITEGSFSRSQQNFKLTGLELKSADLILNANLSGEHIEDNPALQGTISLAPLNPNKVIKDFAIPAPATGNANNFNKLAISFDFAATMDTLDLKNIVLNLDDTTIKGSSRVKNIVSPAVNFDLAIDTLDVDRYAPPAEKNKKNSIIALTAGIAFLPVQTLRTLNINGNLAVANLKVNNLKLQDTQLHLIAKDGLINSNQTVKQFYSGEYSGNLIVDARDALTRLTIDEKVSHIQIEPFLQDLNGKAAMRGTVDVAAQLQAKGNTEAALKSSLTGNLSFANKDGAIIGFSLQKMIDKGKSLIKGADLTTDSGKIEETAFIELTGTAALSKNILTNRDLVATTKNQYFYKLKS